MPRTLQIALPALLTSILVTVALTGFVNERPRTTPAPQQQAEPSTWTVDKAHSAIRFRVRHMGITNVEGKFHDYEVQLSLDPTDVRTLKTTATIDINTVDTGVDRRDNDLRSEGFFFVEQYPTMTFASTGVQDVDGTTFKLLGDLTIRGVTKPVVLDAEMLGPIAGPRGRERVGFTATTTIDRMDYGLKWDRLTEAGGFVVAHDVSITIDVEASRDAPAN
ncbi:MAG TPA: YceI family protein [Rhodothermales bacterium]|nr:YceI family protein [Rhodothermales bacterium]